MTIDCSQLVGRSREICDGVEKNGQPVFISPERRVKFLLRRGFNQYDVEQHVAATTPETPPRPPGPVVEGLPSVVHRKSLIGTRLMELFKQKESQIVPCSDCKREIVRLDGMTPDEVTADRPNIIAKIAARAPSVLPKLWQRWAAAADEALKLGNVRKRIGELLDEAIRTGHLPNPARPSARVSTSRGIGRAFSYRRSVSHEFVTTAQLWEDVKLLMAKVPSDVTAIAGVARSGLNVGTMLSMLLHLPLYAVRQNEGDIIEAGSGWRIGKKQTRGRVLVVDDTVMTGNSFKAIDGLIAERWPKRTTAAVYVNPDALKKPDIWARDLPWPHLLEWNLFNSVLSPNVAVDFDGILCHDCPPGSDDDGPKYEQFLRTAKPLYLPRKAPIPLIVTARLERYRPQTEEWLRRHGLQWHRLVMGPWTDLRERQRHDMGEYKAEHVRHWAKSHRAHPPPLMFIESDDRQAQTIAARSRQLVVCPATAKCYIG
jgi:hypoxanthine phosphoribosyltransferase